MKKKLNGFNKRVIVGWNYLLESRRYIYFSAIIFFIFGVLGFAFSSKLGFLDEVIRDLVEKTSGMGGFELILFIFKNNLSSAFFTLFLGIFLGIFPLFNTVVNGVLIGYVFSRVYEISGVLEFWKILPHGIFELPAIFIAIGLGFRLGGLIFSRNLKRDFRERLKSSLYVFLFIILPLLVVAAIIEGLLITYLG